MKVCFGLFAVAVLSLGLIAVEANAEEYSALVVGADPEPALFSPRDGPARVLETQREVLWNQPPDLDGYRFSSEIIDDYGLESQLADDFEFPDSAVVSHLTFWGGYYNWSPGDPEVTSFNLRFYSDWSCSPNDVLSEYLGIVPQIDFVGYDPHGNPTYAYEAEVRFEAQAHTVYWLVAQACDHPFPPQWGRQQAASEIGCPAMWNNGWYWWWEEVGAIIGEPFDASLVLDGWFEGSQRACCFDDGHCEMLPPEICAEEGGVSQEEGSVCDPDPCHPVATLETTWGLIRTGYR